MSPFASCAVLLLMVASGVSALDHRALDGLTIVLYTSQRPSPSIHWGALCSTGTAVSLYSTIFNTWEGMQYLPSCHWKVSHATEHNLRLSPLYSPGVYLTTDASTLTTWSNRPTKNANTQWKFLEVSPLVFQLQNHLSSYMGFRQTQKSHTQQTLATQWRILTPNYSDDYKLVARLENNGNVPETLSMKVTTGMSTTNTDRTDLSVEATAEYQRTVKKEAGKYVTAITGLQDRSKSWGIEMSGGKEWSQTESSSFSSEKELQMSITVQPGKVKEVYQLVGNFEGFTVGTDYITVQESNADGDVGA